LQGQYDLLKCEHLVWSVARVGAQRLQVR